MDAESSSKEMSRSCWLVLKIFLRIGSTGQEGEWGLGRWPGAAHSGHGSGIFSQGHGIFRTDKDFSPARGQLEKQGGQSLGQQARPGHCAGLCCGVDCCLSLCLLPFCSACLLSSSFLDCKPASKGGIAQWEGNYHFRIKGHGNWPWELFLREFHCL